MRWLQDEIESDHRLEVTLLVGQGVTPPAEELAALIFRAARELLFNVVKHAGTERAQLTLAETEDEIVLAVADDGRGFVRDDAEGRGSGHGLPGVQERVIAHGGRMEIETAPGRGTTVTVALPR